MSGPFAGNRVAKAKGLNCPNCGGPVELRGFGHTLSAVCPSCHSILDTSTPIIKILQTVQVKEEYEPKVPLGSRGEFEGATYEIIGFQRREIREEDDEDGERDGWFEYLLFNPYRGFRYLSEYSGHWNFITTQTALPIYTRTGMKRAVTFLGKTFPHYDGVVAMTSYVIGEFPWRVQVGELAQADDYISPPYMLSSETMEGEVVWSLGRYYTGAQIWQAFKLQPPAPHAYGTFGNQPSPVEGRARSAVRLWLILQAALLAVAILFSITSQRRVAYEHAFSYAPAPPPTQTPQPTTPSDDSDTPPQPPPAPPVQVNPREVSVTTDPFDLTGRTSSAQLTINADMNNVDWAYFNISLIDDSTKQTKMRFGREVNRTSKTDTVLIPSLPSGRYHLLIEPEVHPNDGRIIYLIRVRRDVPTWSWFWFASFLLLIPLFFNWTKERGFEGRRWGVANPAPAGTIPSAPQAGAAKKETDE